MGCAQRPGFDYEKTFSPTIKIDTIQLICSICAKNRRKIKIYDVRTAFLYGALNEELYMEIPDSIGRKNGKVCKLKKKVFVSSSKQVGVGINKYITDTLLQVGLKQCVYDPCLFYIREENSLFTD